jgi:hypothetical protein
MRICFSGNAASGTSHIIKAHGLAQTNYWTVGKAKARNFNHQSLKEGYMISAARPISSNKEKKQQKALMVIYLSRIFHLFCMSNNHCKVYKSIGTLLLVRYRFSDAGFFLALGLNLSKTLGGFNEPLSPSPTGANKLVCFFLVIRINSCKAFLNVTSDRNISNKK